MKRRILLLALTVAVLALVVAVPAFAQTGAPRAPQCGWYEAWSAGDAWWEYWCYWPSFGWEYVFWTY